MAYLKPSIHTYQQQGKRLIIHIKSYPLFINFLNHINNHYDNIKWVGGENLYSWNTIVAVKHYMKFRNNKIYISFSKKLCWGAGFLVRDDSCNIVWSIEDYVPVSNFEKELLEYQGYSTNAILISRTVYNNFRIWPI